MINEEPNCVEKSRVELVFPEKYQLLVDKKETEIAIKEIKTVFEKELSKTLNLMRVTSPRFVRAGTGVNDDLNGIERPVSFTVEDAGGIKAEIVHSLAKWKRMTLADYRFKLGEGLYANMDAIRAQEVLDNLHSVYVDQWDWELIIGEKDRSLDFLKGVVRKIYEAMRETERQICRQIPSISPALAEEITFVHTEDLVEEYPGLSPREREDEICKKHGSVFIIGIGGNLKDGKPHDGRAPDYDDWSTETESGYRGLNGDILVWYPLLNRALEISSMGIRVDPEALKKQLEIAGNTDRINLPWHRKLLNGELPLTVGGGIGQSRLCMLILKKAHIGEVQSSIWPDEMIEQFRLFGIQLL